MTAAGNRAPAGYAHFALGGSEIVALAPLAGSIRDAMREGSLYEYAAHHAQGRPIAGRGVAFAVPLPDGETRAVIRRSRHGGLLAPLTGERFLVPTRAPRELNVSLRLTRCGIPTPDVIAYATYPAGMLLRRADVATREVPGGRDLGALLTDGPGDAGKREALEAVALLVARLTETGVRHPDLNVKNILLARDENEELVAWLLDVDRVWFDDPGAHRVTDRNLRRLGRSARKWRDGRGAAIDEGDLLWLAGAVAAHLDEA
ncbi:MAG: hypothetical protein M3373_00650 [Gemmatimonadota bacterium]|nr:hypothetical protein [Gemmatimonadota bacterium]